MKNLPAIRIALKTIFVILLLIVFLIPVLAFAEPGVVNTGKGLLNMRRKPKDGERLVTTIPNGSSVEILDHADGWYFIEFKGKQGYVKEQFILPLSDSVGKEIYSNGVTVYVRESMDFDSPIVAVINSQQPMTVEQITAEWALVATDSAHGYVKTSDINQLNGKPIAPATHTWEEGVLQAKTVLYKEANQKSGKIGTYQRGQLVYVCAYDKNWSLIWIADQGTIGFGRKPSVKVTGATTTEDPDETIVVDESISIPIGDAHSIAEKALKKYSGFKTGKLNCISDAVLSSHGIKGPMYRFVYTNQSGEYLYAAYVHQYTGDVLYTGDYSQFSGSASTSSVKASAPTKEPVWEYDENGNVVKTPWDELTGSEISQSSARSLADGYLASKYPIFSQTTIMRVSCRHVTDPLEAGWQPPYYQFDYFVDDGRGGSGALAFEIMINGITKEVLYCIGDAPGEGNG